MTPATSTAANGADRRKGYLITILGVVWLSPDALILRLIDSHGLDIVGWRGLLSFVTLTTYLLWRDGGNMLPKLRAGGFPLLILSVAYALNSAAFVMALGEAPAADVLVILAATPICAAALGWLLLREIPARNTMLAILLGALGVAITTVGGISSGASLGMLYAVITTILLAAQFTLLRMWPQVDNVAAVQVGSIWMAAIGFGLADPMAIDGVNMVWMTLLGLFLTPIAFTLVTVGPRYISAAEVSLLMLLETVLGPLWVWWALSEQPGPSALIGGAVVILAVVVSASGAFRLRRGA